MDEARTKTEERCPHCGYTEADKRFHLDHHVCERRQREERERMAWERLNNGAVFPMTPTEMREASADKKQKFAEECRELRDACNHLMRELGVEP